MGQFEDRGGRRGRPMSRTAELVHRDLERNGMSLIEEIMERTNMSVNAVTRELLWLTSNDLAGRDGAMYYAR